MAVENFLVQESYMMAKMLFRGIATTLMLVSSLASMSASCCHAQVAATTRQAMTARIDALIEARLREQGLEPQPICDDATFLRRVTLDLTGRNPAASDVTAFLKDPGADKRERLIDRLLQSPTHAAHLANIWSAWLLPEMQELQFGGAASNGLNSWLRNRFANNLRYDRLVADLLVASGSTATGPGLFFSALESKPEKIAAKTSRVFMGVQLDCAECHDHPYDHWKQRDFWGFAAYFAQLSTQPSMDMPGEVKVTDADAGEVKLPNSEVIVPPRPLVSTGESGLSSGSRRQQLTLWLTAPENPYLARAAVNRCWSLMFGRGLIEPIDDMRSLEMASHPELLHELSQQFAQQGFNLRELLHTLASTQAYQRSSPVVALAAAADSSADSQQANSYAAMPIKPLTATQLATCLQQVARELAGDQNRLQSAQLASQLGKLRGDRSAATLGIVQALVTLHSQQLDRVHQAGSSRLLQALAAPHLDARKRVEWLFMCTLCRPPTAEEAEAILAAPAGDATTPGATLSMADDTWLADLLWALVNSTEFAMTP